MHGLGYTGSSGACPPFRGPSGFWFFFLHHNRKGLTLTYGTRLVQHCARNATQCMSVLYFIDYGPKDMV